MSIRHLALSLTAPNQLELRTLSDEHAGEMANRLRDEIHTGEFVVKMKYSSVQPLDKAMASRHAQPPPTLGVEGVGTVVASRDPDWPMGVTVAFMYRRYLEDFGCWQTFAKLDAKRCCLARIPQEHEHDSPENAERRRLSPKRNPSKNAEDKAPGPLPPLLVRVAAGITSSLTALACLRHFQPGDVVLISAATGAVGSAAAHLAVLQGIHPIALVRGAERARLLRSGSFPGSCSLVAVDCEDDPHWRRELVSEARRGEAPGDSGGRAAGPLTGMIDGVGGALLTQLLTGEEMRGAWEQGAKVVTYGSIGGKVAALEDVVARAGCVLVKEGASSVLGGKSTGSLQGIVDMIVKGEYSPLVAGTVDWKRAQEYVLEKQFVRGRTGRFVLTFDGEG